MYQDLRSKLEMYKSKQVQEEPDSKVIANNSPDVFDGEVCCNDYGSCLLIEKRFPVSHIHGGYPLGRALDVVLPFMKLCGVDNTGFGIRDFIFLDTETTGLSGGAGTVAFLIGTGFFENDAFILRQYFMRDYNEEQAMLDAVNLLLSNYRGLITFNGKTFDWNLLQTRFISNRMRPLLKQPIHLDLLYPSRKIWKLKLESCRLSSLEENILGEHRVDDIPGALIPSVYFKYLEDRDASAVKKILRHNELDILSMVSLMLKIHSMLDNPLDEAGDEHELLGLGSIFEKHGEYSNVLECYSACLNSGNAFLKETAHKRLAGIYKRNGEHLKAAELLQSVLSYSKSPNIPILVELAKYYEHKEKNLSRALELVEQAIRSSMAMGLGNSLNNEALKKRYERLKKKQCK